MFIFICCMLFCLANVFGGFHVIFDKKLFESSLDVMHFGSVAIPDINDLAFLTHWELCSAALLMGLFL